MATPRALAHRSCIHARAHHFKKTKSFWARTHSFAFLDATRLAARAMGGVPEECYAAPSLARWRGPASAREDSTRAHRALDGRAAALMPVVKGVSGSFGGIIEVRNANANRSSRAFSSRDRSRGGVGDGGGDARGGGDGFAGSRDGEGRAARREMSRETRWRD